MPSKVVFITGASSGIGKATAELLFSKGHVVFGTSRKESFPDSVNKYPTVIPLDPGESDSIKSAINFVIKRVGRIDGACLVKNN